MVIYYYQDFNRGIKYSTANKNLAAEHFFSVFGKAENLSSEKKSLKKGLKLQLQSCWPTSKEFRAINQPPPPRTVFYAEIPLVTLDEVKFSILMLRGSARGRKQECGCERR